MPSFSNFYKSISQSIIQKLDEEFRLTFWREPSSFEELLEVLE